MINYNKIFKEYKKEFSTIFTVLASFMIGFMVAFVLVEIGMSTSPNNLKNQSFNGIVYNWNDNYVDVGYIIGHDTVNVYSIYTLSEYLQLGDSITKAKRTSKITVYRNINETIKLYTLDLHVEKNGPEEMKD